MGHLNDKIGVGFKYRALCYLLDPWK